MHVVCPSCGESLEYSRQAPRFCSNCGRALAPSTPGADTSPHEGATVFHGGLVPEGQTPLPECVGGYRLLRPLGAGGMGTVYEGEEPGTGRSVALKVIRPEYDDSADAVERCREGRLASMIAHPRCVFVLAADEEGGRPYIVMELMPGKTLADVVSIVTNLIQRHFSRPVGRWISIAGGSMTPFEGGVGGAPIELISTKHLEKKGFRSCDTASRR